MRMTDMTKEQKKKVWREAKKGIRQSTFTTKSQSEYAQYRTKFFYRIALKRKMKRFITGKDESHFDKMKRIEEEREANGKVPTEDYKAIIQNKIAEKASAGKLTEGSNHSIERV